MVEYCAHSHWLEWWLSVVKPSLVPLQGNAAVPGSSVKPCTVRPGRTFDDCHGWEMELCLSVAVEVVVGTLVVVGVEGTWVTEWLEVASVTVDQKENAADLKRTSVVAGS